jgi:hypothetical protein
VDPVPTTELGVGDDADSNDADGNAEGDDTIVKVKGNERLRSRASENWRTGGGVDLLL